MNEIGIDYVHLGHTNERARIHTGNDNQTRGYVIPDLNLLLNEDDEYVLCVKDLPEQEKPREKLMAVGSKNLTLAELVAVLLGVGTKKEEVLTMPSRILREYGEKTIQHETNPKKIAQALDIPISKASQIVVAFELGRRFFARESDKPVFVRNSTQAYEHIKDMAHSKKEQLRGLYLNSRHELIHDEVISVGSLTANVVHPREVVSARTLKRSGRSYSRT